MCRKGADVVATASHRGASMLGKELQENRSAEGDDASGSWGSAESLRAISTWSLFVLALIGVGGVRARYSAPNRRRVCCRGYAVPSCAKARSTPPAAGARSAANRLRRGANLCFCSHIDLPACLRVDGRLPGVGGLAEGKVARLRLSRQLLATP